MTASSSMTAYSSMTASSSMTAACSMTVGTVTPITPSCRNNPQQTA